MFHESPFEPLEDVVAQAKEEREQLDRLLTISTPRERALVALTALVMLLFGVWLFFGDVARNLSLKGVLIAPVEQELSIDTPLNAVVWPQPNAAQEIRQGVPAMIEVHVDGTTQRLQGTIASLAPVALPEWYRPLDPKAPATMRQIEIALDEIPSFQLLEPLECRVVIYLGVQSPITLFALRPA